MLPADIDRRKMDRRVSGKVFAFENRLPRGIGDADRETFVDRDKWDDRLAVRNSNTVPKVIS